MRRTAEDLARGVDRWFGDKPFEDGGSVKQGVFTLGVVKRQTEKADLTVRFNARFTLPNLREWGYVFVGRDDRRETVTDRPGVLSDVDRTAIGTRESPSFFAGLGRNLGDVFDLRLGFRGVKPYAQARYDEAWHVLSGKLDFRETLFWTVNDRFGSTTSLSFERPLSPTLGLRWVTSGTITQEVKRMQWSSLLGGYRSFGDRRLLAVEALVTGTQNSGPGPTDYGMQARWSQLIYKDWLLGEVLVGHFRPRKNAVDPRQSAWAFGATTRMEF